MWNYQMAIIGHPLPLVWSPPSGSRAQHFQQRVSYGLKTMIGDHGSWWWCGSLTMMIIVATFEEGWLGESAELGGWWPITCDSNKPKEQEVCLWSSWWKMVIMKVTSMEDFMLNIEKNKLAKLRRHASRVHFTKMHFGWKHFRKMHFKKYITSGAPQPCT